MRVNSSWYSSKSSNSKAKTILLVSQAEECKSYPVTRPPRRNVRLGDVLNGDKVPRGDHFIAHNVSRGRCEQSKRPQLDD